MKNYGLLEAPPQKRDYLLGTVKKEVIVEDGQWEGFLPPVEYQKSYKTKFDTYGCVSFSALNCIEMLYRSRGERLNFSDRFTVVESGTVPGRGNYFRNVAESIRKDGVVLEPYYPMVDNKSEYYQSIPKHVYDMVFKVPVYWGWVQYTRTGDSQEKALMDALQFAPVQISVYAWPKPDKDGIYRRTDKTRNHAVTLYGYEKFAYWKIFDHYKGEHKKLAWDYNIGSCVLFSLGGTVDLARKYKDSLIKNADSPKVYYSNGKQIAWIKDEPSFLFGYDAKFWGYWDSIKTVQEKIKEDIKF